MKKIKRVQLTNKKIKKPAGKRPWNRVNLPVYSISSKDEAGTSNMHILTYVTAISMQPKRYICGVFRGTKTLDNIEAHPHFVLQLLGDHQYRLVDLLGKKSGKMIDKISRLAKRKELDEWNGFPILKNCLAVMEMKIIERMEGGDHIAFLCDVIGWKNIEDGQPLTLDVLRKHKLIRI